jgi:two-component system C4-dicarboxylate transport sensor histidine kinase DctB
VARKLIILLYLLASLILGGAVWFFASGTLLAELQQRGRSDLALASDRVVGEFHAHRMLAVAVSQDPRLADETTSTADLKAILLRTTDLSGALDYVLLDAQGTVVVNALGPAPSRWLGQPFVRRGLQGGIGMHHAVSDRFSRRAFYYAVPVFSDAGPVTRALVVVIDVERIEADFRGTRPAVYMTDEDGVVFFSNRSELLFRRRDVLAPPPEGFLETPLRPFVTHEERIFRGAEIWDIEAGRYLPARALHVERDIPLIGMKGEALIDISQASSASFLQALAVSIAWLFFGAIILFVSAQRRTLASANDALEVRVAERTSALSQTNIALRDEIKERKEAEAALTRAQHDLIQAEKLSALGKMSAGISHELNQPLMALQSYAENAATLLERGKTEVARQNLMRIADVARRMGRIIRNFRTFARQEIEPASKVDLGQVVQAAIDLSEQRIAKDGVTLSIDLPDHQVWVQGGEVRLQQVLVNLISNALDAMGGTKDRRLAISVSDRDGVLLEVRDSGPGINDPDKIFEPFYSTKSIGEAEGVGLGLSISYGLVQSFGGNIHGANAPGGGAIFTIELKPWEQAAAA